MYPTKMKDAIFETAFYHNQQVQNINSLYKYTCNKYNHLPGV